MRFLRLDMYLNGKEALVGTADATHDGFDSLMGHNWLVFKRVIAEIEATGVSRLTSAEIEDEDMQDILWDVFDRGVKANDEVNFCMCLWEEEEHVKSAVALAECEAQ